MSVSSSRQDVSRDDKGSSLSPSQLDLRAAQPAPAKQGRRSPSLGIVLGLIVIAAAGMRWLGHDDVPKATATRAEPSPRGPSAPATTAVIAPTPTAVIAPTPPAETAASGATSAVPSVIAPEAPPSAPSTPASASNATPAEPRVVTIIVKPKGSIIFERAKRLGTSKIEVTVEPGQTKHYVALIDNYWPKRFSVDGSSDTVEITLTKHGEHGPATGSGSR